jgi:hypothetical protein
MKSKWTTFKLALVTILLTSSFLSQPSRADVDPNCDDPTAFAACMDLGFGAHTCYQMFCKAVK